MIVRPRHLVHYLTADAKKDPFDIWFQSLTSPIKTKVAVRIDRAEDGNLGDHEPVGGGVWELRIDWGPGPRIYYGENGDDLVLLTGGTKATQKRDIATAKEYWSDYKNG